MGLAAVLLCKEQAHRLPEGGEEGHGAAFWRRTMPAVPEQAAPSSGAGVAMEKETHPRQAPAQPEAEHRQALSMSGDVVGLSVDSIRQRLAAFEVSWLKEHGRGITPADGPSLPAEVLDLYRLHTESLRLSPGAMTAACAELEARWKACDEAKVEEAAAAAARQAERDAHWKQWEETKDAAWLDAKDAAWSARADAIGESNARLLSGAASYVKEDASVAPMGKEEYYQTMREKLGFSDPFAKAAALEREAAEEADWAKSGRQADAADAEERWARANGVAEPSTTPAAPQPDEAVVVVPPQTGRAQQQVPESAPPPAAAPPASADVSEADYAEEEEEAFQAAAFWRRPLPAL